MIWVGTASNKCLIKEVIIIVAITNPEKVISISQVKNSSSISSPHFRILVQVVYVLHNGVGIRVAAAFLVYLMDFT